MEIKAQLFVKNYKMNTTDKYSELSELGKQVSEGLSRSFEKLVEFKIQKNSPLVVSETGKIRFINPDEIRDYIESARNR